ncbi:DNA-cytosine methyltransferase (EC [uncultured Gammaproteobacteria bacterium]|nr:DNA-cytosine methyltransferase (EC [uncultured Gammaproteobacteria bacterium]
MSRHIGNAVPPKLGETIGNCIINHLKEVGNGENKFSDERLKAIQTQMDSESKRYDYFIKDYPFEVIDSKYGEDEKDERTTLYVPAYQRKFVWDNKKKSRFIESVFLGISLMPF